MNCPQCGEVCSGHPEIEPTLATHPATLEAQAVELHPADESQAISGTDAETEMPSQTDVFLERNTESHPETHEATDDGSAWRDELSARLNRFRARRKMSPPRYPSLRLRFDAVASSGESLQGGTTSVVPPVFEPLSDRALALDGTVPPPVAETQVPSPEPAIVYPPAPPTATRGISAHAGTGAKIIKFPRYSHERYSQEPLTFEPPSSPLDQLAEPVMDRPRILEVPEFEPAPPALGGITIEPAQRPEAEKRPGIDIPLQCASLSRRMFASLVDGLIVGVASLLFGYIFWKVAAIRPPQMQVLALAVGVPFVFWAVYQYLLLVYSASTLGLLAAGLELARFDGSRTSRSTRRWRVLASYLSAASLGMGYAWVFLDEDVLCWHDRITHTYLAPRKRAAN